MRWHPRRHRPRRALTWSARCAMALIAGLIALRTFPAAHRLSSPSRTSATNSSSKRAGRCWRRWSLIIAAGRFLYALADRALARAPAPPSQPRQERSKVTIVGAEFARWASPFAFGFAVAYPLTRAVLRGLAGRGEMDRQFRRADPDLRDAGLGPEHRGRSRRACSISATSPSTRSAPIPMRCSRTHFGLSFWLLLPLAGHHGRVLGRAAGLSGAAAARRLSGDRHARLRRDHPPRADQLARGDQRLCRHFRHPEGRRSSAFPFNASHDGFAAGVRPRPVRRRSTARSSSTT